VVDGEIGAGGKRVGILGVETSGDGVSMVVRAGYTELTVCVNKYLERMGATLTRSKRQARSVVGSVGRVG
jgi:hypothetical protein